MFYSCYLYCQKSYHYGEDSHIKTQKIDWLLDNNCPLDSDSNDLTSMILYGKLNFTIYNSYLHKYNNKYFELIKRLYAMGKLCKDLTIDKYIRINPAEKCLNIDQMKWFDKNFKIKYNHDPYLENNVMIYPFYNFIHLQSDIGIINFVCKKIGDINKLKDLYEIFKKIISNCVYIHCFVTLETLYKNKLKETPGMLQFWQEFVNETLHHKNTDDINEEYSYDMNKEDFLWIITNKKVKSFPIQYIKKFKLELNDVVNYLKSNDKDIYKENKYYDNYYFFYSHHFIYCDEVFCDDYKNIKLKDLDKEIEGIDKNIQNVGDYIKYADKQTENTKYTKEYCQIVCNAIMKYMKN